MRSTACSSYLPFSLGLSLVAIGCGPTYPNCDRDDQCHESEFCVNGRCHTCRDDSQCPHGQRCDANECAPIAGWCDGDGDCPGDERCDRNRCVPTVSASTTVTTPPDAGPQVCQLTPAYFAFDESTLDAAARGALADDRACMNERGITSVAVTGMTDPRGTEEYNLALGSRRAETVRGHLRRLGVDRRAISVRSVGEEMSTGTEEAGWGRDRRAELAPR